MLASEFEGAEAARVQSELGGQNLEAFRSFVIDGHRLRYIDSSGLLFLKAAGEGFRRAKGADVRLRAFPSTTLEVLRREGLGTLAAASA